MKTNSESPRYFLIQEDILPEAIKKTIKVKEILKRGEARTINEAVAQLDLSRSAYYKYKDYVFPFYEVTQGKIVTFMLMISHRPGTLSQVLNHIAAHDGSVVTINQGIPMQGVANVSISVETKEMKSSLEDLVEDLKAVQGVTRVEMVGQA